MNGQLEQEFARELRSDERLLWYGQPATGLRLQPADALVIPFSILWAGFAVFWETGVIATDAPILFKLFGVPFVIAGAYITVGRFFFDAYRRSRIAYALTTHRIIFLRTLWGRTVESIDLTGLPQITVQEHRDRSATIAFGPSAGIHSMMAGSGWPGVGKYMPPRFERVANGRDVYDRILRAKESQMATRPQARLLI
jgi:hypothetical protein